MNYKSAVNISMTTGQIWNKTPVLVQSSPVYLLPDVRSGRYIDRQECALQLLAHSIMLEPMLLKPTVFPRTDSANTGRTGRAQPCAVRLCMHGEGDRNRGAQRRS